MISLCKWLHGMPVRRELQFSPDRHTKQSLTQTNHTRWRINTIRSPDDERCDARNMWRRETNTWKSVSSWLLPRISGAHINVSQPLVLFFFFTEAFLYFCLVWLTLFTDINVLWDLWWLVLWNTKRRRYRYTRGTLVLCSAAKYSRTRLRQSNCWA